MNYDDYKRQLMAIIALAEEQFQKCDYADAECGALKWYKHVKQISVYDAETRAFRPFIAAPFRLQDKHASSLLGLLDNAIQNSQVSEDQQTVLRKLQDVWTPSADCSDDDDAEGEVTNEH